MADLLWSHLERTAALNNLRLALWALRRVVGPYLDIDAEAVRFRAEGCFLNVAEFERLAREGLQAQGPQRTRLLRRAAELYRGGLLPGFYDEWVLKHQERLAAPSTFIAEGAGSGLIYKVGLNAYLVLHALGQRAEAYRRLQQAYGDTLDRLRRIQDPQLRRSALQGNRSFREVCEAAHALGLAIQSPKGR